MSASQRSTVNFFSPMDVGNAHQPKRKLEWAAQLVVVHEFGFLDLMHRLNSALAS
jgi:hypothetical protein